MGILLSDAAATAESTATGYSFISTIILIVIFLVMMWVMGGAQRKEQKRTWHQGKSEACSFNGRFSRCSYNQQCNG